MISQKRSQFFPLPKAVLLPGTRLPLHIFEPPLFSNGGRLSKKRRTGCLVCFNQLAMMVDCIQLVVQEKLTQFSETEDGRYMITLTGISRYRIDNEIEGFAPYRRFNVQWDGFAKKTVKCLNKTVNLTETFFFNLLKKVFGG
ncbi:MAG: LON peptidase substrate-binding domain-containing protein [Paracoccaceae bacterium]